jgi:hypothetical protein
MTEIDPLIRREIERMSLGPLEQVNLAPLVIERVRRDRIVKALLSMAAVIVTAVVSIGIYEIANSDSSRTSSQSMLSSNLGTEGRSMIRGLQSDYPVEWEPSVGDLGAISGAGGLGDTLGGLTAAGLKIQWERCGKFQCPIEWRIAFENRTGDLVSASPSLAIFTDHSPLVSDSRPTTLLPGGYAEIVYRFDEFKTSLLPEVAPKWQWNWYLANLR